MAIKIGDFVTSCEAGYWQLIDIKPKIAFTLLFVALSQQKASL